jgi:Domain of unknown function (DUF4345)
MSRRGLQAILTILGLVAVVFGTLTVFTGGAGVIGGGEVSASVDSELRFYASWYAAAGVMMLRAVPRVESAGTTIRALCIVLVIAACARVISIMVIGTPHPVFLVLMIVEFAIPVVIVPWQAAIARRTH